MLLFVRLYHSNVHVNNSVPDVWTGSRPSQDGLVEMDVKMRFLDVPFLTRPVFVVQG